MFFIVGHALGLWSINLSSVLHAHGYSGSVIDNVWCTSAIAAIISPLIVGALADQRFSSERVLRWLGLGAATFLCALFYAIHQRWHWSAVLALAQVHALWSAPSFGLATSLVISRLSDAKTQFGPIRAWATLGWMLAGPMVSWVLFSDEKVWAGFAAAFVWLVAIAFTFLLKPMPPPGQKEHRTWRDILGLDAWSLLRHPDHRVVFVGAALFNIPLAAFYPHTVLHLKDLGVQHQTAMMSLAQITEAIGLLALSWLLTRVRLKWLFLGGIAAGALRYWLFSHNSVALLCLGIVMHGVCFTLFFMTAQIYLEQRIPTAMRSRAQALLSLMMSGFGNFIGFQGCGWWRHVCERSGVMDWSTYWLGLTGVIAVIFLWFAISYKGRHRV
jgi:nucleoside transporter